MHLTAVVAGLLLIIDTPFAAAKSPPKNAILLSQVQTLTLRGGGAKTTHRRLPAVPQLKCLSTSKICRLHDIDVLRCTNQGAGYDGEDVQWSCTANLPPTLKLGSTDVICEGYSSSDDPYVLKGSCGVEYRLALTDEGESKYPDLASGGGFGGWFGEDAETRRKGDLSGYLFAVLFFGVAAWIVYSACTAQARNLRAGGARRRGGGGGGGGGGWGGGGGGGPGWQPWNDPPPPYPGNDKPTQTRRNEGWRPGFWSGLASGVAGSYMAGNRASRNAGYGSRNDGWGSRGAGPSGTSSFGSSSSSGSNTRESTGFGSTTRR